MENCPDKQAVVPTDPELAAICRAHVSFLRPGREGRKVFKTLDQTWLQQSSSVWPLGAIERIYRYIHTHNLYQISSIHDAHLMEVGKAFQSAANLPAVPQILEEIAQKCFSLLLPAIKTWQSEGLIIPGNNNALVKCPLFQSLWGHAIQLHRKRKQSSVSKGKVSAVSAVDKAKAYPKSVTLSNDISPENKYPKKRCSETPQSPPTSHRVKRPRKYSYEEDAEGDTEDCIIVSVPQTINKGRRGQSCKKYDSEDATALDTAPLVPKTEIEHSEDHSDSESHSVISALGNSYALSTTESSVSNLNQSGSHQALPTEEPEPRQALGHRPEVKDSSELYVSPSPQQTVDGHVQIDCPLQGHPSAFPPAPSEGIRLVSSKASKEDDARHPLGPLSPRSPEASSTSNPSAIYEVSCLRGESESANPCPSPPCSNETSGDAENITSCLSHKANCESGQSLPRTSCQEQDKIAPIGATASAGISPLLDNTLGGHSGTISFDPLASTTASSTAPLSLKPTFLEAVAPPHALSRVNDGSNSLLKTIASKALATAIEGHGSLQADHISNPVVENQTPHKFSAPQGQGLPNKTRPLRISQLLSPESPKLSISTAAINSTTTQSPPHSSQDSSPNATYLLSSRVISHPIENPYRPPPVSFTGSNHMNSELPPAQLKCLTSTFDKIARISIETPKSPDKRASLRFFPIRAIMSCELRLFFKWYSHTSSSDGQCLLRFELVDVTCQSEKGFIISENQPDSFRLLKQYIWDMFWTESHIRGPLEVFTVTIEPYLPLLNNISRPEDSIPSPDSATNQSSPRAHANEAKHPSQPPVSNFPTVVAQSLPPPRTSAEKMTLRMRAERTNVRLFADEIAGNGTTLRTDPLTGCGAVVDMRSGVGRLIIWGNDKIQINTISTDPQYTGYPYLDIRIPDGCICEVHGYTAILLYYHFATMSTSCAAPVKATTLNLRDQAASTPKQINVPCPPLQATATEILIRIQLTPSGKLSPPYHKDVMCPKVSTTEFFAWFYNEVNRTGVPFVNSHSDEPGPVQLNQLAFILKDAMPNPITNFLTRGDEGHFIYMRKYIKDQYEKARVFCPGLREFVVVVKVPGTSNIDMSDEEW